MKPKRKSTKLSPTEQKTKRMEKKKCYTEEEIAKAVQLARELLESGNKKAALGYAETAVEMVPQSSANAEPFEFLGEVLIELSEPSCAYRVFQQAVERRRNVPPENYQLGEEAKFLWLGQLSEDEESEGWYLQGISTLENIINNKNTMEEDDGDSLRKIVHEKLCNCYCNLIELYLTDLWYVFLLRICAFAKME